MVEKNKSINTSKVPIVEMDNTLLNYSNIMENCSINISSNDGNISNKNENYNNKSQKDKNLNYGDDYIRKISNKTINNEKDNIISKDNNNTKYLNKKKILSELLRCENISKKLSLMDQRNAIYENEDIINIDKDHSIAHGEGHNSIRKRKMSVGINNNSDFYSFKPMCSRRNSIDVKLKPRQFLVDVDQTQSKILQQEDTNGDFQITIDDAGPKTFNLGTVQSDGYHKADIRGTYALSNLLQELALAKDYGRDVIVIDEDRLNEQPVERLHRIIKYQFWDSLTRRIDEQGLEIICNDPKNSTADHSRRIYIPYTDQRALDYYNEIAERRKDLALEVIRLPKVITPQYVKSINKYPGILSLALREEDMEINDINNESNNDQAINKSQNTSTNEMVNENELTSETTVSNAKILTNNKNSKTKTILRGIPFVVPGGRFNEMYGWDSYFETLGLLVDEHPYLGKSMVDNFVYQIEYYGKILNANRSYYLTRSQPPFLTDMINRVYYDGISKKIINNHENTNKLNNDINNTLRKLSTKASSNFKTIPKSLTKQSLFDWQRVSFTAAIKELLSVWLKTPRLDLNTGLSCYHPEGIGMPPETESTHFDAVLSTYAKKHNVDVPILKELYDKQEIIDSDLDEYFVNDRAVRESGHDTSYRLEGKCAHLATVDLNSLLFKYETDIAEFILNFMNNEMILQVRRGENDENLKSYNNWQKSIESNNYKEMIGNNKKWNSEWASGIIIIQNENNNENDPNSIENIKKFNSYINDNCKNQNQNEKKSIYCCSPSFLPSPSSTYFYVKLTSNLFLNLAKIRKNAINTYLWNSKKNMYYDWNCKEKCQSIYDSVTALWPLWSGCVNGVGSFKFPDEFEKANASTTGDITTTTTNNNSNSDKINQEENESENSNTNNDESQAEKLIKQCLKHFEVTGGLVTCTKESRGETGLYRPNRQWDYPYGWAPHQILAWKALERYNHKEEAQRLAYRWMYTILRSFVYFNGVVPEKFDVVSVNHKCKVEYGNVGTDFKCVSKEGFGWMNASFEVGLTYLTKKQIIALDTLINPDQYFTRIKREKKVIIN